MDLTTAWLVIPAFNEAKGGAISATVRQARRVFANIVVVDDCSYDQTGDLALAEGAHVCCHPVNLGQGAALATGIQYALDRGAEEIVTFDADGQHDVRDAEALVLTLRDRKVDVVLGSRFLRDGAGVPPRRRLLLKAAVAFTRATTGLKVTDTHNGLRALGRSAAMRIAIRQNRMAHASEILAQIARLRLSYVEVPTCIVYTDYSVAKGQRMSDAFTILGDLLIRRFYR